VGNTLTDLMVKSFLIKTEKNAEIRLIFPRRIAKIASIKTIESCHFWCNNTELFCEEYLTAT